MRSKGHSLGVRLSIKDKPLFKRYLNLKPHKLSVYAFENIYIWKATFDIRWRIINGNLCVFFRDKFGCFAYLPPLGEKIKPAVIEETFKIMDGFNKNKDISRIENPEEEDISFYEELGLKARQKSFDYVCNVQGLADLKGDKFKSKRACYNYFVKNYQFAYLPFSVKNKDECLKLYALWAKGRKAKTEDKIYRAMLSDSRGCLKILLRDYTHLNITGRIVKIGGRIKAFTFGFPINPDTFCILYEIADLSVKGSAQFIFRRFCRELSGYKYINIMDDSGLENLKQVKLSYHPEKLIPAYIITRKNG